MSTVQTPATVARHLAGQRIVPALGALVAVVLVVVFIAALALTGGWGFLIAALAVCPVAVLVIPHVFRTRYDSFEPLSFVVLATLLGTTMRTWYVLLYDTPNARDFLLLGREPEFLIPALLLITAGLASLCVGVGQGLALAVERV